MSLRNLLLAGVMTMRVVATCPDSHEAASLCVEGALADYLSGLEGYGGGGQLCDTDKTLTEAECEDYCSSDPSTSSNPYSTVSATDKIPACYRVFAGCHFNVHPVGFQPVGYDYFPSVTAACLAVARPTPAPTVAPAKGPHTVSGDPIFKINGFTVKFDLPLHVDTLLLSGHGIDVFGRADVTTPDYKNQWFSTISILKDKFMSALIERKALRATHPEHQALNSLSFVLTNQDGRTMMISNPGEYEGGEFTLRHAGLLGRRIPREVVTVKLRGFEFAVGAQIANKFKEKEMQLNYAHLDLDLHDMRPATKGLFAEFFGITPMSKNTAQLIKRVYK